MASDTTLDAPSEDVVKRQYPDAELTESLPGYQSFVDIEKALTLLDWQPQHTWREEYCELLLTAGIGSLNERR